MADWPRRDPRNRSRSRSGSRSQSRSQSRNRNGGKQGRRSGDHNNKGRGNRRSFDHLAGDKVTHQEKDRHRLEDVIRRSSKRDVWSEETYSASTGYAYPRAEEDKRAFHSSFVSSGREGESEGDSGSYTRSSNASSNSGGDSDYSESRSEPQPLQDSNNEYYAREWEDANGHQLIPGTNLPFSAENEDYPYQDPLDPRNDEEEDAVSMQDAALQEALLKARSQVENYRDENEEQSSFRDVPLSDEHCDLNDMEQSTISTQNQNGNEEEKEGAPKNKEKEDEQKIISVAICAGCLCVFVIIGIIVMAVLGAKSVTNNKAKNVASRAPSTAPMSVPTTIQPTTSVPTTIQPTTSPTVAPTRVQFMDIPVWLETFLSNSTLKTASADPSSSQAKALQFAKNDPYFNVSPNDTSILNLTSEQLNIKRLNRIGLATLFYATGGAVSWGNGTDWLSAKDECLWLYYSCAGNGSSVTSATSNNTTSDSNNTNTSNTDNQNTTVGTIRSSTLRRRFLQFTTNVTTTTTTPITVVSSNALPSLRMIGIHISGTLPVEISLLSNLRTLSIHPDDTLMNSSNYSNSTVGQLHGTLPSQLGLLVELKELDLHANLLTGTIPTWLGLLTNLQVLRVESNLFTVGSSIPQEVCALTTNNLKTLVVDCDRLKCCSTPNGGNIFGHENTTSPTILPSNLTLHNTTEPTLVISSAPTIAPLSFSSNSTTATVIMNTTA